MNPGGQVQTKSPTRSVAGAAVSARVLGAVVDVFLAIVAAETGLAGASVAVDQVDASAAVLATG